MPANRLEVPKHLEETQSDPKTPDPNCLDREDMVAATAWDAVPGQNRFQAFPSHRKRSLTYPVGMVDSQRKEEAFVSEATEKKKKDNENFSLHSRKQEV